MPYTKLSTGDRLRFEQGVISQGSGIPARTRRKHLAFPVLGIVAVIGLLAVGASRYAHLPPRSGKSAELTRMAEIVLDALKSNRVEDALAATAESEPGRTELREDDQRR